MRNHRKFDKGVKLKHSLMGPKDQRNIKTRNGKSRKNI